MDDRDVPSNFTQIVTPDQTTQGFVSPQNLKPGIFYMLTTKQWSLYKHEIYWSLEILAVVPRGQVDIQTVVFLHCSTTNSHHLFQHSRTNLNKIFWERTVSAQDVLQNPSKSNNHIFSYLLAQCSLNELGKVKWQWPYADKWAVCKSVSS